VLALNVVWDEGAVVRPLGLFLVAGGSIAAAFYCCSGRGSNGMVAARPRLGIAWCVNACQPGISHEMEAGATLAASA
jgi:hypothetical protein